jgi:hypothetical protein
VFIFILVNMRHIISIPLLLLLLLYHLKLNAQAFVTVPLDDAESVAVQFEEIALQIPLSDDDAVAGISLTGFAFVFFVHASLYVGELFYNFDFISSLPYAMRSKGFVRAR